MDEKKNEEQILKIQMQINEISEICKILKESEGEYDVESHRTFIDGKDKSSWPILDFSHPLNIHCMTDKKEFKEVKNKLSKFLLKM